MSTRREGGNLVSQVHQISGRVFAKVLKAHGVEEFNPAQGRILYVLWQEGEIAQSELAARTKLDKSTLALMLDRLEEQRQIERLSDPSDSRKKNVRSTAKDRALNDAYTAASDEMNEIFYRGLSETEIERFEKSLKKILANLDDY